MNVLALLGSTSAVVTPPLLKYVPTMKPSAMFQYASTFSTVIPLPTRSGRLPMTCFTAATSPGVGGLQYGYL